MINFRLLGPLEVVRDGRSLDLGGPKQRAVLASLLLNAGRVVSTDRLAENLWGEDPPASVLPSLQAFVSNLRRLLRDDQRVTSPIVRQAPGYLLDVPSSDIDLTVFTTECQNARAAIENGRWDEAVRAGTAAVSLVRGGLLADFQDEDWVRSAAVAVDERQAACDQDLVTGLLGLGRVAEALAISGRLLAGSPLDERGCWLHMIALYRAGRGVDALDVFGRHSRALDDELGLNVGPPLRDLQAAILRQDPELDTWPVRVADRSAPPVIEPQTPAHMPAEPPSTPQASGFVGRRREMASIAAVMRSALVAGTRWVLLTGEAGIGKSRLAEEAVAGWVSGGGRVSRARCPEDNSVPPWWPIRQIVLDLGRDPAVELRIDDGSDADTARYAAYDRIKVMLQQTARVDPLAVLIDDVQWADPASLRLLGYLAEDLDCPGLVFILTQRAVQAVPDLGRLLAGMARRPGSLQISLPPLSTDEVAAMASAIQGRSIDDQAARQLSVRTGGNPFFVGECARLTDEEVTAGNVPVAIRSVLQLRLSALDPEVRKMLEMAAVMDTALDISRLCDVTGLDRDELAGLLDEATDDHMIVAEAGSGSYTFAHALLRDEILAGIAQTRRQRMNLKIADSIGQGVAGEWLGRRAMHLFAAMPLAEPRDVVDACRAAAAAAENDWQSDAAARWWHMALQALERTNDPTADERDDLIVARVAALARSGRSQTVLDTVDAALIEAMRTGRTESAGRLAAILLRTSGSWPWLVFGSDPGPVLATLEALAAEIRSDSGARARILAALAVGTVYHPDETLHDSLSAEAIDLAEQLGDPEVLADALLGRAHTLCAIAERSDEVISLLDRLASIPHRFEKVDTVIAHGILFNARMALGDPGAADHVRLGAVGSDALRLPVSRMQMRWAEAELAHWQGESLADAEEMYESAIAAHRRTELYESSVHDIARLTLRWDQGRVAEFPELADVDPGVLPWARAVVAAASNDPDADGLIAEELARDEPLIWTTAARLTMLAHAVADRGLTNLVTPLRRRLEPLAGFIANVGLVGTVGTVALALAKLCGLGGDEPAARTHLQTAHDISVRTGGRVSLLHCRIVAAQIDDRFGRRPEPDELRAIAREASARGVFGVQRLALDLLSTVGVSSERA